MLTTSNLFTITAHAAKRLKTDGHVRRQRFRLRPLLRRPLLLRTVQHLLMMITFSFLHYTHSTIQCCDTAGRVMASRI